VYTHCYIYCWLKRYLSDPSQSGNSQATIIGLLYITELYKLRCRGVGLHDLLQLDLVYQFRLSITQLHLTVLSVPRYHWYQTETNCVDK
jgi:hypothetical protein